jgi:hypothetical protein
MLNKKRVRKLLWLKLDLERQDFVLRVTQADEEVEEGRRGRR